MQRFLIDGIEHEAELQADCWVRPSVKLEAHGPHIWNTPGSIFGPYYCNGYPPPEPPQGRYLSHRQ